MFSLRKRAPIDVYLPNPQLPKNLTARTSPSTFLFLPSSQCQRADLQTLAGQTSSGQSPQNSFREQNTLSGCPAQCPPCQKNVNSGSQKLNVVNVAGCIRHTEVCQHPISNFNTVKTRNQKAQITSNSPPLHRQFLSNFRSLPVAAGLAAPRSPAMSRVIGAPAEPVNPGK